ncbi:MAG TPA: hypothetical protein VKY65_18225 [Alphaproteobacteria bacterium]|nr:hypothetical protein [Alphaproteobacteria bacterium]
MDIFILKLVLTPLLIGGASLAVRRWGQGVGGWLVGLPLTSGPVAFFLALEHGTGYAASAALGSLSGVMAEASFCLGYGWAATRAGWPLAFLAGSVTFAAATILLQMLTLGLLDAFLGAIMCLVVILRLMPSGRESVILAPPPRWDIPGRMIVATALIFGLTSAATALGPRLSGILATFPIFAGTLAVFAHHLQGPRAAFSVLRGLLLGLFSFAGFFPVLAILIERGGIALAFVAASLVSLLIQGVTLWVVRREAGRGAAIGRDEIA